MPQSMGRRELDTTEGLNLPGFTCVWLLPSAGCLWELPLGTDKTGT